MKIQREDTAIVFIDPQNEVLSEKGLAWPLVRESLQENNTIENMERIFKAAKAHGFELFISPHYFYPTDKGWKFNGPLETDEATSGMFGFVELYGPSELHPEPRRHRPGTFRPRRRPQALGGGQGLYKQIQEPYFHWLDHRRLARIAASRIAESLWFKKTMSKNQLMSLKVTISTIFDVLFSKGE